MKVTTTLAAALLLSALAVAGCDREETPVQNAVESTKDALNMREHEKLKDAGEDMGDALENAVEGIQEETDGR